jgi:protein tyrosine/serine phosphatase
MLKRMSRRRVRPARIKTFAVRAKKMSCPSGFYKNAKHAEERNVLSPRSEIMLEIKAMKKQFASLLITIVALLAFNAAAQNIEPDYPELPNFHKVNDGLYRGAQPKAGGLQKLRTLGIKTVINLRDDDAREQNEEREAKASGLEYFNIPLSNKSAPSDAQIEQALKLINTPANQPVFVHCKRGADRTGTIIATYRISHDGWTGERATAEAKHYGMGFWQLGMKDFISDYYKKHKAQSNT